MILSMNIDFSFCLTFELLLVISIMILTNMNLAIWISGSAETQFNFTIFLLLYYYLPLIRKIVCQSNFESPFPPQEWFVQSLVRFVQLVRGEVENVNV
jgi:hypothetical protein